LRTSKVKKGRGAVLLAACIILLCAAVGAALHACAGRAAPEGSSLERAKPVQKAVFPLGTTAWRVSDAYGWRTDPITGEEVFHRGTDLACAEGTAVLAAMDGVVTAARRSATYGNYLRLSHSGGQETLYAHLQYLFVRAGEVVQSGQPLGTAGETGRSTGAHLHFEFLVQGVRYDAGALLGLP